MQWTRTAAASCITLLIVLAVTAAGAVAEDAPVTAVGNGTVIGSVEVDYRPLKGLLGKMRESTRSRKWSVRIALEQDGGHLYHVAKVLEIREGAPRTFVLQLPANAYRFVDMENALSGGVESQVVPIDAHFRDADLALALKDNPGLALDAVETDLMTPGKESPPPAQSTVPPPTASADTQPATEKP